MYVRPFGAGPVETFCFNVAVVAVVVGLVTWLVVGWPGWLPGLVGLPAAVVALALQHRRLRRER